ncbi:fatty acid desaturase family protein [Dietzia sp.]|uniref:fatty acid desaturase family protein n=1 Tax=Dietzia sp. TaxID=1871616 RepID=UPI002FDB9475
MAVQDITAYAHLTDADVEEIGRRFAEIEKNNRESLGDADVRYIRRLIATQRTLDVVARGAIAVTPAARFPAAAVLGLAKILENLEIGHNVMHGQWDWMNDPEIHSSTWEWDNVGPSSGWKHTHNVTHHTFTNIIGMDNDIGYGVLRVTRDKPWKPYNLAQPLINTVLASLFEYAVGFYDVELGAYFAKKATWEETKPKLDEALAKVRKQALKDYVAFPLVSAGVSAAVALATGKPVGRSAFTGATRAGQAAMLANLARNVWAYAVIFCGHFPDDVETFTKRTLDEESRAEWYLRQMLGSANFTGGTTLSILSGNLNYQIEHHLFPDMPSNRLAGIAREVRAIADEYGLPYNVASFPRQMFEVQRTLLKLSLPNKYLRSDPSNAPEVRSDAAFTDNPEVAAATGHKQLRKGLAMLKRMRPKVMA